MSPDEWFRQLSSSDFSSQPAGTQSLQDFLAGKISVHTAAKNFTAEAARPENSSERVEEEIYRMWNLVIDLAESFPETQDKVVELLAEIEKLPDLERHGHTFTYHGMTVWSDLPTFGWEMRERWNHFDPPPDDPDQANARLRWKNINAFAARITAFPCANTYKTYGLWSLRQALEDDAQENGYEYLPTLDGSVPAAAQWIFHAGQVIFACEDKIEPSRQRGDPLRGGALWKGKSEFSKERWSLWKTRFEWMQGVETLAASTKEIAKKAVEAMEQIEKDANGGSG